MLFHTPHFGVFLLAVLIGNEILRSHPRLQRGFLLATSYAFYMAWNEKLILLILFSTLLDWLVGAAIYRNREPRVRKALLWVSLVGNLGVLAAFKYYDFFAENLVQLLTRLGLPAPLPELQLILPVGISFYTFQTLSYTIGIYQGRIEPRRSLLDFSLFVSFFPQLVAGPVVRAEQFLPQLDATPDLSEATESSGLYRILTGLVKKVVLADLLGAWLVDPVLETPAEFGALWVILAIYAFKFQIFCDFSGYTDIAIGCGRLLGFRLPENFRSPYKATSIRDYWSRWHITLGSWFRDFVFFPLGGSRRGPGRTAFNIVLTMFLVGLWHGADWTFILWGVYYGVFLVIERFLRQIFPRLRREPSAGFPRLLAIFTTFQLTAVATIFFRAAGIDNLRQILHAMTLPTGSGPDHATAALAILAIAIAAHFAPEAWKGRQQRIFVGLSAAGQAAIVVAVLLAVRLAVTVPRPYYYFQF